jgi:hypothetical protein
MNEPTSPRRALHSRSINCQAFERDDGLIDLEGTLVDTKPMALQLVTREVPGGEPIHLMRVVLTITRDRTIVRVRAYSDATPYRECGEIGPAYAKLEGLRIEPGFTKLVKRLLGGVQGCTHVTELIPPLASTAFQVLWADGNFGGPDAPGSAERTSPLGGCHALRPDGPVVKVHFSHLKGTR